MKNILELFYDRPSSIQEQDSTFVRMARIKNERIELLMDALSQEQKELLEGYFEADTQIECVLEFEKFRYAFHLGAQLMAELTAGGEELLQ